MGNVAERMQKKIDKREKYYSKLEKQIERQANAYKNQMTIAINQQFGTGTNNWNPAASLNSIFSGGGIGMTESTYAMLQNLPEDKRALVNYIMQNGNTFVKETAGTGADAKETGKYNASYDPTITGITDAVIKECSGYANQIKMAQQQQATMANNWKTAYEQQINEWIDAQKESLDMQKEWEMDLLEEEQADMEAEKTSVEAQLELAKQRKEAIEQELGNSIKDAAPKFGLG